MRADFHHWLVGSHSRYAAPRDGRRPGFTLIELSIVLVVIGLLVGGILVGRDLIYTAELRSVVRQIEQYDTAVMTFKDKYRGLPGDHPNAVEFGLGDAACPSPMPCPPPIPTAPHAFAGCNGDGNLRLSVENSTTDYAWCPENLNFWHHLARAGMIAGAYDGKTIATTTSGFLEVGQHYGVSAPLTKLRQVGISVMDDSYDIGLGLGTGKPELRVFEAHHFDSKLDDGQPITGRIVIINGTGGCADSSDNIYYPSHPTAMCAIRLRGIAGFEPPPW